MFTYLQKPLTIEISRFVKMGMFFISNHLKEMDIQFISSYKALIILIIEKVCLYYA